MSWLEELKVGDAVIIDAGSTAVRLAQYTVDRITKTQFIIGTWRFRRADGDRIGPYTLTSPYVKLLQPTPELYNRIRRDKLIGYITRSKDIMERLPLDMLGTFAAQLQSVTPVGSKAG
jgi:hypothetical protein